MGLRLESEDRWFLARPPAGAYLVLQGVGALVWWAAMAASPTVRDRFVGGPAGWQAARTLVLADCIVFGLGSIAAGIMLGRVGRSRARILWVVVGASWYATLVAVLWLFDPIEEWLGLVVMIPATLMTTGIAFAHERQT